MGSDNGLAPIRRQAITWTNDDLGWYASLGLLLKVNLLERIFPLTLKGYRRLPIYNCFVLYWVCWHNLSLGRFSRVKLCITTQHWYRNTSKWYITYRNSHMFVRWSKETHAHFNGHSYNCCKTTFINEHKFFPAPLMIISCKSRVKWLVVGHI